MKTELGIEPESREEVEFLERLAEVREFGIEETDMTVHEVGAVMGYFASGVHNRQTAQKSRRSKHECPVCGQEIKEVNSPGLGEDPTIEPCGCSVEYSDLDPGLFLNDA